MDDPGWRATRLEDVEAVPWPGGLTWRPVRAALGLHAFGAGGFTAKRAGTMVVEPHAGDGTAVLALGGPPVFAPAGSEWLMRARPHLPESPARARALLAEGRAELPDSPAIAYGFALLAAAEGRDADARAELAFALQREPRLVDEARADGLA